MKLEFLAKNAKPDARHLATVESSVGSDGRCHGVVVACNVSESSAWNPAKSKAKQELANMVDANRGPLTAELGCEPNSEQLVAALLKGEHAARFRAV